MILATFLTVVVSTAVVTWRLTPMYRAQATVELLPISMASSEASRMVEIFIDPQRGIQTQVELIKSDAVLNGAAKELGLSGPSDLRGLSVELLPNTLILTIAAEHPRPDEARNWANAVAQSYIDYRRDRALETSLGVSEKIVKDLNAVRARITELNLDPGSPAARSELEKAAVRAAALEAQLQTLPDAEALSRGGGSIISAASLPQVPVRPNKTLNITLSALVGIILALGMAYLAENLDDTLTSPEEVESRVGAPILGYIPLVKEWKDHKFKLAMESEHGSSAEESYRTLMTNLRFASLEEPVRVILVTSPVAEIGKSTTAANLAATMAQAGEKVLLVSADLRRPSAHKFFGLTNSRGLLQALDRRYQLPDALQKDPRRKTFRLLAAGGIPPNPTEILDSDRFREIMSGLDGLFDIVIVDSPPVLGLGDASALASQVDGILFVVRSGSVTNREISHAVDQLKKAGGRIIGCVMNAIDPVDGYGYYYNYYYSQYTTNGHKTTTTEPEEEGHEKEIEVEA